MTHILPFGENLTTLTNLSCATIANEYSILTVGGPGVSAGAGISVMRQILISASAPAVAKIGNVGWKSMPIIGSFLSFSLACHTV